MKLTSTWDYWKRHRQTSGDERKKSIYGERENYSKQNYIAEISLKG